MSDVNILTTDNDSYGTESKRLVLSAFVAEADSFVSLLGSPMILMLY